MALSDWIRESRERLNQNGLSGVKRTATEFGFGVTRRLDDRLGWSDHIYQQEWDVLLVLDACRADLMSEVVDEYEFLNEGTARSVAGGSRPWMQRTFAKQYREETENTVYVTGNPFSDDVLESHWFQTLNEVWSHAWDEKLNTVPARALTDVAIYEHRRQTPERMIVHYMQPHHPFVPEPMDSGMNRDDVSNPEDPIWQQVKRGEELVDKVWNAYRENLRYVLDDVELLLSNLDAEQVVITADHGNAIGEWGYYGHGDIPIDAVRKVPWCETSARDTGKHDPEIEPKEDQLAVEEKLEDLGYL